MQGKTVDILYQNTEKGFQIERHFHNCYEIIFVKSGTVSLEISGRNYRVNEGSIVFINKFESHNLSVESYPYSRYFLLVNPEFLYRTLNDPVLLSIFKQRPEHFSHAVTPDRSLFAKIDRLFEDTLTEYSEKKPLWSSAAGALLHLLILEVYRSHREAFPASAMNNQMKTIIGVQGYIDKNYIEDIRLSDVSSKFHIDMYYLSHLFSKYTGYTFKEYITLQRLFKARDLLCNTTASVTCVGLDSGFNNVNHFIRIFKKYEGLTPLQYRKRAKKLI